MKKLRSILLVVVVFVVIPLAGLVLLWRDRCVDTVVATAPSPDGGFKAAAVLTDCGETMKVATSVRIENATTDEFTDYREAVIVLHGKTPVELTWPEQNTLEIGVPKDAVTVSRRPAWHEVTVRYREI